VGCELDVLVNLKECEKYSLLVNEEIGIDKTVVCLYLKYGVLWYKVLQVRSDMIKRINTFIREVA